MDLDPEVYLFREMRRCHSAPDKSFLRKTIRRQIFSESPRDFWVIEWLSQPGFLGLAGFCPGQLWSNVLSFRLVRSAWDQGIATEAAHAVLGYGFRDLDLPFVVAFAHKENRRSHLVLNKIGMKPDGIAVLPQRSMLNVTKTADVRQQR
jgi:RimJ/RimL family protein N-acetyltransferase